MQESELNDDREEKLAKKIEAPDSDDNYKQDKQWKKNHRYS
jgi:hypothetical protein